jgi:hypothetical protein
MSQRIFGGFAANDEYRKEEKAARHNDHELIHAVFAL